MERTILTRRILRRLTAQPASESTLPLNSSFQKADSYQAQFLKLMPVEVISTYITIEGLLRGSVLPKDDPTLYAGLLWIVFITLAILDPLYLRHVIKVRNRRQIGLSAGAFLLYIVSLGGPFLLLGFDEAVVRLLGSIMIPIYTLVALIVLNK